MTESKDTESVLDDDIDVSMPSEEEQTEAIDGELSEPEAAETTAAEPEPEPARKRSGGALGFFWGFLMFLLTAGAVALSGWLYYRIEYQGTLAGVSNTLDSTRGELQSLATDEKALEQKVAELTGQQTQLAERIDGFKTEIDQSSDSTIKALNDALSRTPPTEKRWKEAEVEYLLRIANHRVALEQDAAGALALLQAADEILVELDDFALTDVRARIADEMLALRTVRQRDAQGLFLRLEALKDRIKALPLELPEYKVEIPEVETEDDIAGRLGKFFAQLFRFRDFEGMNQQLITPEERIYLELNLRLMLERAQLAGLRGQQVVYVDSLATAEQWIDEYMASEKAAVEPLLAELRELQALNLEQAMPDISGSLNRLVELKRGQGS